MSQLPRSFGGSQQGVVTPIGDRLIGALGSSEEQRVFGRGEPGAADLGAGVVAKGWAAGARAHAVKNSGHKKSLTRGYLRGHNKYMNAGHIPTAITPAGAKYKAWCSCGWFSTPRISPRAALDAIQCEHGADETWWSDEDPTWNDRAKLELLGWPWEPRR